ncbi:hypothetical protein VTP01DRAFT_8152 [Rhizomucor pusillus]|uniref:uncharacterized protein n=1 Tax=Rhizomucor pusillus TaxID=4840 RepID=UPI003742A368
MTDKASTADPKVAEGGVVDTQNRRVSGKNWKLRKTATGRAQKAKYLRRSWEQRTEERKKKEAVKALEKQMKDEIQAEKDVQETADYNGA